MSQVVDVQKLELPNECDDRFQVAVVGADENTRVGICDILRGVKIVTYDVIENPKVLAQEAKLLIADFSDDFGLMAKITGDVKRLFPELPVMALTLRSDLETIVPCLMAGVNGCLVKPVRGQNLCSAFSRILSGRLALCRDSELVLKKWFSQLGYRAEHYVLTQRERQIMALLAAGLQDKEMSAKLRISRHTIHVHLSSIFRKLEAHNRRHALRKFFCC